MHHSGIRSTTIELNYQGIGLFTSCAFSQNVEKQPDLYLACMLRDNSRKRRLVAGAST
jgi:hypothetical protein